MDIDELVKRLDVASKWISGQDVSNKSPDIYLPMRDAIDALLALHRHAEAMAAELEWFDALEHETAAWAAFNYRADFPRKP